MANTLIGSLAIFTLQATTKNPNLSNALGYLIGSCFGYILHARYTFRASVSLRSMLAYTSVVVISFGVNLLVLNLFLRLVQPFFAQFIAIGSYVIISYILNSRLAFPVHARANDHSASMRKDELTQ